MITLSSITSGYGDKTILHNISCKIDPTKITVIMGPNGCGKTTLLQTIMGLVKTSSGYISYNGKKIKPSPNEWLKNGLFMVGQKQRVFPDMTVRDNIMIATHHWKSREQFPEKLDEVLKHFPDLIKRLDDRAGNLSGGQQQMVAIARGLINNPKTLLLDEPSIGLSPKLISETFQKIAQLNRELNTGFVIVEHNLKTLLPLTDNSIIINSGHIVYDGPSDGKTLDNMIANIF